MADINSDKLQYPEQQEQNQETEYVKVPREQLEQMAKEYQQMEADLKELHACNDKVLKAVIETGLMPAKGEDPDSVKKRLKQVITKASSQFAKNFFKMGETDLTKIKEIQPLINIQSVVTRINNIVQQYGNSEAERQIREAIEGAGTEQNGQEQLGKGNGDAGKGKDNGRNEGRKEWSTGKSNGQAGTSDDR